MTQSHDQEFAARHLEASLAKFTDQDGNWPPVLLPPREMWDQLDEITRNAFKFAYYRAEELCQARSSATPNPPHGPTKSGKLPAIMYLAQHVSRFCTDDGYLPDYPKLPHVVWHALSREAQLAYILGYCVCIKEFEMD